MTNMSSNHKRQAINCRESIAKLVADFRPHARESFTGPLYFPNDFKEPDLEQFISITKGLPGCKEQYPTILVFWVYALFDFVESQMQDHKFEQQAQQSLCETVTETVMHEQIKECFRKLESRFSPSFIYQGPILTIYRMFNVAMRVSFAIETTQNYHAFFWERDTGTKGVKRKE